MRAYDANSSCGKRLRASYAAARARYVARRNASSAVLYDDARRHIICCCYIILHICARVLLRRGMALSWRISAALIITAARGSISALSLATYLHDGRGPSRISGALLRAISLTTAWPGPYLFISCIAGAPLRAGGISCFRQRQRRSRHLRACRRIMPIYAVAAPRFLACCFSGRVARVRGTIAR